MTKKARRRQIMEAVGYTDRRVQYADEWDRGFTYTRTGELLKEELREVLKHLDAYHQHHETQTKSAWRKHIRDVCGIEGRYEPFSLHELTKIWQACREVNDD